MSLTQHDRTLHSVGYRRAILSLGVVWGAVPALSFGLGMLSPLSPDTGFLLVGALMTLSLGVVYELDSRALADHGRGVPLAWSYALVAPLSLLAALVVPALLTVGFLLGPPASALAYLWQRGRVASVA